MEKLNKVAEVSILFWLMKIVATTLGETFGDYLSMTLDYGYLISLGLTFAAFVLLVALQVSAKKYFPLLFWGVIIATTTLGTEISDFIDRSLHLGYTLGSVLLFSCLLITLYFWFKKFKNLEVYPIIERQKEMYYWTAILFSNSLGTAFGDYLGDALGFTYLQGAMITATVILLVIGLHYATKINHVILFWLAFIFTRPFGATFGDFLTKPIANGGLDLGTLPASMVSMSLMLILIFIASFQLQKKSQ